MMDSYPIQGGVESQCTCTATVVALHVHVYYKSINKCKHLACSAGVILEQNTTISQAFDALILDA